MSSENKEPSRNPLINEEADAEGETHKKGIVIDGQTPTLNELPLDTIQRILGFNLPEEIARLSEVSRSLKKSTDDDPSIWNSFLLRGTDSKNPKGEYQNNPWERISTYWPKFHDNEEAVRFYYEVSKKYPDEPEALLALACIILNDPNIYVRMKDTIGATHDNSEQYATNLLNHLFSLELENSKQAEIFMKIGFMVLNNQLQYEHFAGFPQLMLEAPPDNLYPWVAEFFIRNAAHLGSWNAKVMIAFLIHDDEIEALDSDFDGTTVQTEEMLLKPIYEQSQHLLAQAKANWLTTQDKFLINASEAEQWVAFYQQAFASCPFEAVRGFIDNQQEKLINKAIDDFNHCRLPNWLKAILKDDPKYLVSGLAKKLAIDRDNFFTDTECAEIYYRLAIKLFETFIEVKKYSANIEDHRLLHQSMPHIFELAKQSAHLGFPAGKEFYSRLLKIYGASPSTTDFKERKYSTMDNGKSTVISTALDRSAATTAKPNEFKWMTFEEAERLGRDMVFESGPGFFHRPKINEAKDGLTPEASTDDTSVQEPSSKLSAAGNT